VLDARERDNGEFVDEEQWLEYTGLPDREVLLEKAAR
jgi:hypothetical protein